MMDPKPLLIGGEWISRTDQVLRSVNPATGETNYEVCAASPVHVAQAVEVAKQAAEKAAWRNMLPHQRALILSRIADRIGEQADELSRLQMIENGKVRAECRSQAAAAAATFRYYAGVCETVGAELPPPRGNYLSMTRYEPYGVVAAMTPWNSPLTMDAQKVAPAIAAGNAVILKPSEVTPSNALALGRIALEAGLPPGILNVLPGEGAQTGRALVQHSGVRMISFTGGTATGREIARTAADRLVPTALELGGKSPHVLFDDAPLDAAVDGILSGIFEGSGQSCVAGSRLFVQRRVMNEAISRLLEKARALRVDLPEVQGAQMGPIASFRHRESVERHVVAAREDGGEVLCGGSRPDDPRLAPGAFYLPTIIAGLDNDSRLARQEIFGPVLCVLPFDDEEDLLRQANDSVYGLAAGLWTEDYRRAWRVACSLEAGTVWINTYKQLSIATPFGGYKDSGLGREKGVTGLRLYQQVKSVYWGLAG